MIKRATGSLLAMSLFFVAGGASAATEDAPEVTKVKESKNSLIVKVKKEDLRKKKGQFQIRYKAKGDKNSKILKFKKDFDKKGKITKKLRDLKKNTRYTVKVKVKKDGGKNYSDYSELLTLKTKK